ncbi:MAG: HPr(Ser) kinase/phosphatase [Ruminococcaceae bacterium]|nr:HPr(Ser) kinase/phosphatase [Oscillospiraceae bacterium]
MKNIYTVPLTQLVEEAGLSVCYRASDYEKIRITVEDVSRPGLPMAGFFDHFEPMRLQVMGTVEMSYLDKLSSEGRSIVFDRFFSYKIPALIIARGNMPHPECLEQAQKYDVTILLSSESTSYVVSFLITALKNHLAPRITRHGVLVDVYGEGMLLLGDSGIGKSEAAVELLKRGHRLIADDAVEIKKISETRLVGTAPELIRNYIELRGIGVINVAKLFGMASIKEETFINLIINIVPWSDHEIYDRLGLENQYVELLGVKVPSITIPVTPGRNLAVNLEVAAMNNRQKRMGYNAAVEFTEQINRHFDQAMNE